MKNLKLTLKKKGYTNLPDEILFAEGLSTQAKIIYCYIRKYSAQGKKCFVSNAFLQGLMSGKKGPISDSQVNSYLKELESQGLITRGMQNNKRIMYAHDWSDRKNTFGYNENILPVESIPSTDRKNSFYTIEGKVARYNTVDTTDHTTVDTANEEPLLVDNEVKDKKEKLDMNKDELKKWTFKYIFGYQWSTKEGYKDLLCNLPKEELAQLESYLEKNRLEPFKDPINTVIEKRLFVA